MPTDVNRVRACLKNSDFKNLFIEELGWNRYPGRPLSLTLADVTYTLEPLAEKKGFAVFVCAPGPDGGIPTYAERSKIDRQVEKLAHEHLIVYRDRAETVQRWQWVRRETGRPTRCREYEFVPGRKENDVAQRLANIAVELDEEEKATIVSISSKVTKSFDVDRVTKRFYDRFKAEREAFLGFIEGIKKADDRAWYASVMLNRLMFVYFIQKKGFLDGDLDYLGNRLKLTRSKHGANHFLTFYRYFLLRLFHDGLGRPDRTSELEALLGKVPYLNGGIFDVHKLECENPEIQIPDEAFERIFAFFDSYRWHLDDRPLKADNEINPDVLGYIFEKYVNQKEMGAYYTKEDITEYIAKNTIIPFLFDAARKDCKIAFEKDGALWRLLSDNPDRYICDAVLKGVDVPLPAEIEVGIGDVSKRGGWNVPADDDHALPTETWREHVARRQRCLDIRTKLKNGEVHEVDDLITLNLNIRQLAQDAIASCEGPELLRAFYRAIEKVSVLDPTCGSGAFLFAALNVLEPLYEACLTRMEGFLDDLERSGEKHRATRYADFREILGRVAEHPSREYFVLKSIVVNNLYGVDIMEEAVEICKLRLFLKLVAQIERVDQLEPLPDVDFNVRAGNTLVGFATLEDVKKAITTAASGQGKLLFSEEQEALARITEQAEIADRAFQKFHQMQIEQKMKASEFAAAKLALQQRLCQLRDDLDRYLATQYGVNPKDRKGFATWRESHQPFHWCVEFYGIVTGGGFDVIIGNPPYVEYGKVRQDYAVLGYVTEPCGNLYAFVYERLFALSSDSTRTGLVIPLGAFATERMSPLAGLVSEMSRLLCVSNFGVRPSKLFDGVNWRLSIVLGAVSRGRGAHTLTCRHLRWQAGERSQLLDRITYCDSQATPKGLGLAKYSDDVASAVLRRMLARAGTQPIDLFVRAHRSDWFVHYQEATQYWVKAMDRLPYYEKNGAASPPAHSRFLYFSDQRTASLICATLNSSLFYYYFNVLSDCYHLSDGLVRAFPLVSGVMQEHDLPVLAQTLMDRLEANAAIEEIRTARGDVIRYAALTYKGAKPVIDEIDRVLAKHYGFTDEELDYIINYDIKYRMGADAGEGD